MEFGITTNLNVKISDNDLDILSRASWIRCSLNATDKKIYNKIHKPINGGLNQVLDNIGLLPNINISYVIVNENVEDIVKTTKLVKDLGVNSIFFRLEMTFNDKMRNSNYLYKVKSKLREVKKLESNSFKIYSIHDNIKINDDLMCYYSNHTAYIDAYGDVYPCCVTKCDKKYIYGNIMNKHFKEFWYQDKRMKNYKKLNMKTCPPCIHYTDNSILDLLYNDDKIHNNFI
jgi:radical SAM protein with 4Fe4S-binding SPASM domain